MSDVRIIVTPGETTLIDAFRAIGVDIVVENLLIGDIHIKKGDTVVYILERKAKGDLDASIKDGRYHEQKGRLFETGVPRRNIVYIVEDLTRPRDEPSKKRVWSAMTNSQHRDGVTVFQTRNTAETAQYIVSLARSVEQFGNDGDKEKTPNDVVVDIKKRSVTPDDWFQHCLSLIPKCSSEIATVICAKYPSAATLRSAFAADGPTALANLRHGATQRRVGPKLSESICNFMKKLE